ncbi:hypothetical protein [Streptomyces sp. NPDC002845]
MPYAQTRTVMPYAQTRTVMPYAQTRTVMPYTPPLWPVSVKGAAPDARDRVLLLRNERDEWELPGGRLETGSPDAAQLPDTSPSPAGAS